MTPHINVVRTSQEVYSMPEKDYRIMGLSYLLVNQGNTVCIINNKIILLPGSSYSPPTGAGVPIYYDDMISWRFDATGVDSPINYLLISMSKIESIEKNICNNSMC